MMEHVFFSVISTSLSVSLVILLLAVLTPLIDRRYAAKWKYLAWILLALRLVLPIDPAAVQDFFQNPDPETAVEKIDSEKEPMTPNPPQATRLSRRIVLEMPSGMQEPLISADETLQITPLTILICIWLAGSVIFACIHLCSYLHYKRLLVRDGIRINNLRTDLQSKQSVQNDTVLMKLLQEVCGELHLRKKISVVKYAGADSPMVTGFLQPVLVLPAESYSDEALYYILKHELVHFMRNDVYWKLLFVLANAVHWFNPVVWFMHREAVGDMELSCDERVVSGADRKSKHAYTEALYTMLQQKYTRKHPLSTQFYGGKYIMQKRFRNILGRSVKQSGFFILAGTAALMIGGGLLIGCSVSEIDQPGQSTEPNGSTTVQFENPPAESPGPTLPESTTLTYIMEGEPEEQTAALYAGDGYSIYVPDDDWIQYGSDMWHFVHNDKIRFWITRYDSRSLEAVRKEMGEIQALLPVMESGRENELEGQIGDMITRARLIEYAEANCVWAVFYSYPVDATEGAGARLPVITDTFCILQSDSDYIDDSTYIDFWKFDDSVSETEANVLRFQNGLQLILPEAWIGKTLLEISPACRSAATGSDDYRLENRLAVYEKNNAEAHYGGELIFLDYIRRVELPYSIYGNKAAEIYRVLGVYRQDDQEYALIYAKYPEGGYSADDRNTAPDDPKLQKDYQDLYDLADDVQIITDQIPGFTRCDVHDLDWIYIEGLSEPD